MTGIQVPVDANLSALEKKLDALGRKIDALNRKKWSPVDPSAIERDANKVERTLSNARDRSSGRGSTPTGIGDSPQEEARRERYGIRKRYTSAPDIGDVPRSAFSGFGGGFSQIANAWSRGAIAGAQGGGGLGGGIAGLLKGSAIGALAFGAFKAASAASEGIDLARDRAETLDTLKRQMGDVGIAFERLKVASESAAYGLGINSKDFAALEQQMNAASRGADKDPLALQDATSVAAGFGRSYGIDPGAAVNLFGGARNIDPRQSYREFALILAETIEKSGMASRPNEVMQALVSFGSLASRLSLSAPNYGAFAGAYSGMAGSGITGMTPEVAAAILGQANGAVSHMGDAGEAGQAFTFAAFQRSGRGLNPLEASALAAGGLFGSRSSVFGKGSAMESLLGSDAAGKLAGGAGADKTNFEMILAQSRALTGGNGMLGRELQAEMIQRYFGLQSMQQAASLIGLQDNNQMGGLARMIKAAGIDPSKINYTNAQTLAKIGNADGMGGLDSIYADLKTREGPSALSKADTDNIDAARGKGEGAFRNALFTAANGKDYAQDQFTVARESKAVLDDIKANTGDKLFGAITTLTGDMVALMGGRKSLDAGLARDAEYTQSLIEADKQSKLAAAHQGAPDLAMAMVGIGMAPSDKIKKINDDANAAEQAAMQKARDEATGKSAGTAASSHEINVNVKAVNPATGQATTIHTQKVSLGPPRGSGTANVTAN